MADIADSADSTVEHFANLEIQKISEAASKIPAGCAGDCDYCGDYFVRLVGGACGRCRDIFKLDK